MSGINNGPGDIELKVILFLNIHFFLKDFNVAFGITLAPTNQGLSSLVTSDPHTELIPITLPHFFNHIW